MHRCGAEPHNGWPLGLPSSTRPPMQLMWTQRLPHPRRYSLCIRRRLLEAPPKLCTAGEASRVLLPSALPPPALLLLLALLLPLLVRGIQPGTGWAAAAMPERRRAKGMTCCVNVESSCGTRGAEKGRGSACQR